VNLKTIQNAITSKAGRQILQVRKHSPTILFAAGVVGVVATVVLASRATLKLDEVLTDAAEDLDSVKETLEHSSDRYSDDDARKDTTLIYVRSAIRIAKLYAPAVAVGIISIGALTGSHVILSRRNVALTAAYAALEKGFRQYRDRVREAYGDEREAELRYGVCTADIVEEVDGKKVTRTITKPAGASIYARFFDETCSSWEPNPLHNQLFVQCQQNYANDLLRARGHVFLNEVYDMLGLSRTPAGAIVGWVKSDDNYIDFGVFREGYQYQGTRFVVGDERSILLDFNVDGPIWDLI